MRTYKIRRYQQGKNKTTGDPYLHYSLTIPTAMAEQLPEGMQFQIELTDEGILYRPIGQANDVAELLPAWARNASDAMSKNENEPEEEYADAGMPMDDPEPEPKPRGSVPVEATTGRKNNARKRPQRKTARK